MSENIKNPFHNKDFGVKQNHVVGDVIDAAKDTIKAIKSIFKKAPVSGKKIQQHEGVLIASIEGRPIQEIEKIYLDRRTNKKVNNWQSDYGKFSGNHDSIQKQAVSKMNEFGRNINGWVVVKLADYKNAYGNEQQQIVTPTVGGATTISQPSISNEWEVLIPLKETMQQSLVLKGIAPSDRIDTLANQFYNEIVVKDSSNSFEQINYFDYPVNHASEASDAIITGIIKYINNLKSSSNEGKELTKVEQAIVNATAKTESAITNLAKEKAANTIGQTIMDNWIWIVGGIIALIIIVVISKK